MADFAYRLDCTVVLRQPRGVLSLTTPCAAGKDLLSPGAAPDHRLTPDAHYDRLAAPPPPPFLVAGVRNVLSNPRCVAYSRETCDRLSLPFGTLATVAGEPETPGRPYHALVSRGGRLSLEEFTPDGPLSRPQSALADADWLVTSTPVLWDNGRDLFERLVTDAADHSHVWRLPRGNHPAATDGTRAQWAALQGVFRDTLPLGRGEAARRLVALADRFGLQREDRYLHSVWGVTAAGDLVILVAHGRLEALGRRLAALGCRRAVCVENSGSAALYHVREPGVRPWLPLLSAPNFRPAGTAFVFFPLAAGSFETLPG